MKIKAQIDRMVGENNRIKAYASVKHPPESEKPSRIHFAMALTHFIYTFKQNDTHALIH